MKRVRDWLNQHNGYMPSNRLLVAVEVGIAVILFSTVVTVAAVAIVIATC